MKKNKNSSQGSNRSEGKTKQNDKNAMVILIIALLFFLLGLLALAKATGFFKKFGMNYGMGSGQYGINGGSGAPGSRGPAGTGSGSGSGSGTGTGSNGSNGNNGGTGAGNGQNLNLNTKDGTNLDVGVDDQGRLYVSPQVNQNNNSGAEIKLNNDEVIDSGSVLR